MITKIRPHHGLCIQHFIGKGYSEDFVDHMTKVIRELERDDDSLIQLVVKADTICSHCPHNQEALCISGQKVEQYDRKCLELCNLEEGKILTWKEYKDITKRNIIDVDKLEKVCINCGWIAICKPSN